MQKWTCGEPSPRFLEPPEALRLVNVLLEGVWTCRLLDGVHIVSLCDVATRRFTDEEEWLIRDKRGAF